MTLTTRQVVNTYYDPTGAYAASGTVTFTPSAAVLDSADGIIVPAQPVVGYVEAGHLSVNLVPTDVDQPLPRTYTVVENINGVSRSFSIQVPSGSTPLVLATVAPTLPQPAAYSYVLASAVGAVGGPAGPLDSSGLIPSAQIPGGSGGGVQLGGDLGGTNSVPQVIGTHLTSALPIAQGGTGQATQQTAINALTGTQSAGKYLRSDGTNAGLAAVQAADVPTLNQNTTGTAANVTATLDQIPTAAANVALGSHKLTGLANGTVSTDSAAFGQIPVAGTTAGTYAAGNDSRITGALQSASNLSDVASASTARTNLAVPPSSRLISAGTGLTGGGDLTADRTLTVSYGTTAGTAAQGNDSRITGALQSASNLSDVGSVTTARTNLGISDPYYPAAGYGMVALSCDPQLAQFKSGISGNTIWCTRVWVPAGAAITNLWYAVPTVGTYATSATPNQIAVYTDSGTPVSGASIPNNNNLWVTTSNGWGGGAVSTPVAAQTTGRYVYLVAIVGGMTGLQWAFPASAGSAQYTFLGPSGGNQRAMFASGTALPASFTPSTYGTGTGFLAVAGIS